MKNAILLPILFFVLILVQTGFSFHFSIFGITLNFILIVVVLLNLFEKAEARAGLFAGFWGGFFLDVFSLSGNLFFGFYTLISLLLAFFIKFIIKSYVQFPVAKRA